MKSTVAVVPLTAPQVLQRAVDFIELTKPRLNAMVLLTIALGFWLGQGDDWARLIAVLLGTFGTGGGAAALNMFLERESDARMRRTQDRPLPAGRIAPLHALVFGSLLAVSGLVCLMLAVNRLTCLLAAAALAIYVFVYTPLKRRTWLCTAVGATAGAMPPLIGWAAARGTLAGGAWVLFAILFVWQLPHFWAIGWLYRRDYARGGFAVLPALDADGRRTARHVVGSSAALLLVSLAPWFTGFAGAVYCLTAVLLGLGFIACAVRLAVTRSEAVARKVFLASLLYLPLLLSAMLLNRAAM